MWRSILYDSEISLGGKNIRPWNILHNWNRGSRGRFAFFVPKKRQKAEVSSVHTRGSVVGHDQDGWIERYRTTREHKIRAPDVGIIQHPLPKWIPKNHFHGRVRRSPTSHSPPSSTRSPSPSTSSWSRPPLRSSHHPFHSQTANLIHSIPAAAALWLLTSAGPKEVG